MGTPVVAIQCASCRWWWYYHDERPTEPFICSCCKEGRSVWDDIIEVPPSSTRLKAIDKK